MSRAPSHSRSHSRHDSTYSTSSAVRSTSPSPSASPISMHDEGLSRRLSWNRPREESLTVQDVQHVMTHTPTPPMPSVPAPPPSDPNGGQGSSHPSTGLHQPRGSVAFSPNGEIDLAASHTRPYFFQLQSEASLGSAGDEFDSSRSDVAIGGVGVGVGGIASGSGGAEDMERLTPNMDAGGSGDNVAGSSRRQRVYDGEGLIRSPVPSRLSEMVRRSPTLRNVSNQLRKASVRVVNIIGADHDGMVRLQDEDEDGVEHQPPPIPIQPPPPVQVLPPVEGLRGRTLCIFTASSRTRRAMDKLLRYPWTEPAILAMIITNVVVLAIQSSSPLNEPRVDSGYFTSWEDFVLLALFAVFTLEMFARIVVSGLILDPETSLQDFLFSPTQGVLTVAERRIQRARGTVQRNLSRTGPPRSQSWKTERTTEAKTPMTAGGKTRLLSELPFQKAVAKQLTLSAQGRPYLRHSWHRIDMIAVFAFWITFILAITGQEATASRHIYIFRALSVLRAARLLVITSGTTTILHSLKQAGPLLITVTFFICFAAAVFSIIGVQSFRGSFRRNCILTDPNNSSNTIDMSDSAPWSQACGGWIDPTNLTNARYLNTDGFESEISAKGYICPINQVCQTTGAGLNGNAESFDNVFAALVQVIVIASANTWSQTMYASMDSDYYSSSLYFLAAIIVLNFWLINLLVAVVVNTFKDIRAETKRSAFGADQSLLQADPQWATETKRQQTSTLLKWYEKTELFWVFLILLDLIAQACKTANSSGDTINLLKNIEIAATLAFDLEIIIRFAGYMPDYRDFFHRGRNNFDLFLALMCSIIQIPAISSATVYPWLTVFQLLRWYRFILAFPRMKPLLVTVFGSFAGLLNMVIFLFLMNFIGALMAVQLIRGDIALGDTITFSQAYNSFLGMYQIFSSENWTTVLYAAMDAEFDFAQGWIVCIFLCGWFLFSNFVMLQMFIAVINENFAVAEELKRKQQIEAFIRKAEPASAHVSWIDRLNPYRLMKPQHKAVKVETLPPNLVLPLKQTIGADVGAPKMKADDANSTKGAMKRLFGFETKEAAIPLRHLARPRSARVEDLDDFEDDRGLTDLLPPINAGPSVDEHMDAIRERRNQQADFIAAHPTFDQSLWLFKQNNPVRRFCQACVAPAYGERIFGRAPNPIMELVFKGILFLSIVGSIVVAGIATPLYRKDYYAEHGFHRGTWFDLAEVGIGMIFILEAAIKIIADGFVFAPNAYLLSLWNVLDFGILLTLLVNTTTSLIFIGGLSRVTRALKGFRALRLITLFSRLRDTFHAVIFAGALRILDASILMVLYLIPFAVWGLNIFSGLLYFCNDGNSTGLVDCFNEYVSNPIDNSLNFLAPRVWSNPNESASVWAFDSFRQSILILFEIVSLEGWINVMASVMTIVGQDQQPQDNASQWNAIFFLIFNLFGGVIILTLFVSIIIENFSIRSGMALLTKEQRQWVDLSKFIKRQTPSQLPKDKPETPLRAWCYRRATDKSGYWAQSFTAIYYLHMLLLMFEDYSNNIVSDYQLNWIFLSLTILYAVDLLIRFFGVGFNSFRSNGWNLFDLVVITGSFATTIPALQASAAGLPGDQVNVQLQKLFLVSISFKLVQRIDSLNQLFKTSVASLPAIGNLFLLWATLFLFFAIVFMEVFGLTKQGNNAYSRLQNYYSLGNTLIMLSFMSTGEGWNGYMHDYTVSGSRCTSNSNYLESDCGSAAWAYALFISWNIISMFIFVNMFTGVVVESFAYVYQMPGGSSLNREEIRSFKHVWAEFDTERSGYIKRKDFVKFFSRLTGVFEVRIHPAEFTISNLVRASIPDPVENASGKLLVANGVRRAVDIRRVEAQIRMIDYKKVRARRQLYARLFHEARISEEPGKGISFTAMMIMLAHYKLIDDEKALLLDDLLIRRAKMERVTDLVNLDRVRGLLRTVYWRRRFVARRDEKRRTLAAEAEGIPAIVLEPTPATPPHEPAETSLAMIPELTTPMAVGDISPLASTSPESHSRSAPLSPEAHRDGMTGSGSGSGRGHSPTLSVSSLAGPGGLSGGGGGSGGVGSGNRSPVASRPLTRQVSSSSSMLSSEDAHRRESPSPSEEVNADGFFDSMATSVWGDMMREAVDTEDA